MADFALTERQECAAGTPVADILVSAAAGSGKTAVLTERIIRNLLDPGANVGICDMLIVTFTKAAAGELKSRISQAINEAAARNPSDRRLRRQLTLLENAHISTIHSFCSELIKKHFRELGLPASMRITEAAEAKLLNKTVMERVIDELYEKRGDSFNDFAENFIGLRDGRLSDTLLQLYEKLLSYPDGISSVKKSAAEHGRIAEAGIDTSAYGEQIKLHMNRLAVYYLGGVDRITAYLENAGEPLCRQLQAFNDDRDFLSKLTKARSLSLSELGELIGGHSYYKMKPIKAESKSDEYIRCEELRREYKKRISEFYTDFLSQTNEGIRKSAVKSAAFCNELYETLSAFDRELTDEKKRRGILDYSDLEKYAHRLLRRNGEITETAREIAAGFKQIYIDEYQDINVIQDEIFTAIGSNNIFMVGDIKQSIYSFRGSAPELFARYRGEFPDYDKNAPLPQPAFRVFLTENFRCDKSIINFSNRVFASLFNNNSGRVPYLPEDALVFGKCGNTQENKVSVVLVNSNESSAKARLSAQAAYVAEEIKKLICGGTKPSDIAIILRRSKGVALFFKNALDNLKIAYPSDSGRILLEQPDILFITALLSSIDNPRSDIAVAAALKSPMFAFSVNELALLARGRESGLYAAVSERAKPAGAGDALADKCARFTGWLEDCRRYAKARSADELLRYLDSEYSLGAVIKASCDNPSEAEDNLNAFYALTASFESGSFKGLNNFIRYVSDLRAGQITIDAQSSAEGTDESGVNILTVHQSKGLEFKVCFLCDTEASVNNPDAREDLLTDRELGISLKLRDDTGFVRYDTVMRKAAALHVTESVTDEEMRVLYVALTRAKNKLYIIASAQEPEELLAECRNIAGQRSYYAYYRSRSFIKWILSSLTPGVMSDDDYEIIKAAPAENGVSGTVSDGGYVKSDEEQVNTVELGYIKSAVCFEYPYEAELGLPAKLAVSALFPGVLDDDEDSMKRVPAELPAFMSEEEADAGGAERGTATHLFMQFCDFNRVASCGVKDELERLVSMKFITAHSARLVYTDKLEGFFRSPLFNEIRNSTRVFREYRFNTRMSAAEFTEDEVKRKKLSDINASVFVQGVIDCFYEYGDGYKIIDYKTDRVYGEAPDQAIKREYSGQLGYYSRALEKITGKKVLCVSIYSLDLQKEIVL